MKIITILSLYLTASLSFALSVTSDKTDDDAFTYDDSGLCIDIPNCYPSLKNLPEIDDNSQFPPMPLRVGKSIAVYRPSWGDFSFVVAGIDEAKNDAFTYDDSRLCEGIPNCYPSMKNLPEIDDNSQFPPMPLRVGKSASACGASFGSNFSFIIAGADGGRKIINSNKKIDEYEAIYNKYSALGFSSKTDANAYFNIHILNNTSNNQLGYLRWITYEFNNSIKNYVINFGTTITEYSKPLFPLENRHNNTSDNTSTYKHLWLCNDAMNCQFIKLSDICDTSPKPPTPLRFSYGHYYPETTNHDCTSFLSIPTLLQGFSSEADASINIQLFDSPTALKDKDKQNHSTKIKHDFESSIYLTKLKEE